MWFASSEVPKSNPVFACGIDSALTALKAFAIHWDGVTEAIRLAIEEAMAPQGQRALWVVYGVWGGLHLV